METKRPFFTPGELKLLQDYLKKESASYKNLNNSPTRPSNSEIRTMNIASFEPGLGPPSFTMSIVNKTNASLDKIIKQSTGKKPRR